LKPIKDMSNEEYKRACQVSINQLKPIAEKIKTLKQQKMNAKNESEIERINVQLSAVLEQKDQIYQIFKLGTGNHAMSVVIKDRDILFYDSNGRTDYTGNFIDHIRLIMDRVLINHMKKYPDSKINEFGFRQPELLSGATVNAIKNITGTFDAGVCASLATYVPWLFIINPNSDVISLMEVYNSKVKQLNDTVSFNARARKDVLDDGLCFNPDQCVEMYQSHIIKFFKFVAWTLNYAYEFNTNSIGKLMYKNNYEMLSSRAKERSKRLE
jgi:hypothetical protein